MLPPDMQVDHRGDEARVPQQLADGQYIDTGFQHARRKTVPENVRTDDLCDSCEGGGHLAGFLDRSRRKGHVLSLPREKIVAWLVQLPVLAQFLQQSR